MKWLAALALLASLSLVGCTNEARQACKDAVRQEYMNADRVLQQPADLDAFCAAWNNHPPGTP